MDGLDMRFMELAADGFECSQILMILALEIDGAENSDLIRAMGGLNGGMGRCGKCCGSLTGGCAVLGYFTAKGEADEMEHEHSREMISEYVHWFEEQYGSSGGTDCKTILHGDFSQCMRICAPIVRECFEKLMKILMENGVLE